MHTPEQLFDEALVWLRDHYTEYRFFVERDLVWTFQRRLQDQIHDLGLPYRVFNDYPMLPGSNRWLCADIALLAEPVVHPSLQSPTGKWGTSTAPAVAAEFKYEPAASRRKRLSVLVPPEIDIWPTKGQVTAWSGDVESAAHDISRAQQFVAEHRSNVAYAIFVDEGGLNRQRPEIAPGHWFDWRNGVAVHVAKVQSATVE